jgi:hypothetical protein
MIAWTFELSQRPGLTFNALYPGTQLATKMVA